MNHTAQRKYLALAGALLALSAQQAGAQIQYSSGHIDIGVAYEDGDWDLHIHDEETDVEYEPNELYFHGSEANSSEFKLTAPGAGAFGFLGASGDDIYIFPQVEDNGLPFIGIAAEENVLGDFIDDLLIINMVSFSGPGSFFMYQTDGFGSPTVYFDTSDGIDSSDVYTLGVPGHAHFNYAFTEAGIYTVGITATGTPDTPMSAESVSSTAFYTFGVNQVVPEPSAYALIAGLVGISLVGCRRRRV